MTAQPSAALAAVETPAPVVKKRAMREDDLLDFVWIADPQVSADGLQIAFARVEVDRKEDTYQTSVWLVAAAGGGGGAPADAPRRQPARRGPRRKARGVVRPARCGRGPPV